VLSLSCLDIVRTTGGFCESVNDLNAFTNVSFFGCHGWHHRANRITLCASVRSTARRFSLIVCPQEPSTERELVIRPRTPRELIGQPLCEAEPAGNARAQELRGVDLGHEACHGLVTPEGGASWPLGCLDGRERFSWVCCERDGPFHCAGRLLAACEFDGIDREYRQQHLIDGRLASAVPHSPPRGTRDSCGDAPAA